MLVTVLAALAATPSLTVRQVCDAAGGLPTAKSPLEVTATVGDKALGTAKLGTLESTVATSTFSLRMDGRLSDVRTLELVAFSTDGKVLARALVDVDVTTGAVTGADGVNLAVTASYRGEEVRAGGDEERLTVKVELHDTVAEYAAMVALTDLTGDGAYVEGDPVDQAEALVALSGPGRTLVSRYTFDDAHPIDSARQTWSGSLPVDAAFDGAEVTFTGKADRCLPDGVLAPADGTLAWTETLALRGSARAPRWKSVALGLREPEVETWVWPFVARVSDASAEGVYVTLTTKDGVAPRASAIWQRSPARERLSASLALGDGLDALAGRVTVHPRGRADLPLATLDFTRTAESIAWTVTSWLTTDDGATPLFDTATESYALASGPGRGGRGASARFDGEAYRFSSVTVSGPDELDWDGTLEVSVGGEATWDDLEVTWTLGRGAGAPKAATVPLTELVSVFEGTFVFDADPSGATYTWDCRGCGESFVPFEAKPTNLGTGTRTTTSQASTKAELL